MVKSSLEYGTLLAAMPSFASNKKVTSWIQKSYLTGWGPGPRGSVMEVPLTEMPHSDACTSSQAKFTGDRGPHLTT